MFFFYFSTASTCDLIMSLWRFDWIIFDLTWWGCFMICLERFEASEKYYVRNKMIWSDLIWRRNLEIYFCSYFERVDCVANDVSFDCVLKGGQINMSTTIILEHFLFSNKHNLNAMIISNCHFQIWCQSMDFRFGFQQFQILKIDVDGCLIFILSFTAPCSITLFVFTTRVSTLHNKQLITVDRTST